MFLKDRAMAEQFDRESTESVLQQDLTDARQEIGEVPLLQRDWIHA